ncbi:MAG: alanine racemase [Candidatus Edwardsbacteria bacterium RIFOXYD12_FULL_50_11]|uniref:Alanine racemase n=1 Tax=Candidatus Edwardsbacteria bacterium GWF2_54_11 TaxID=1817851 RepID=A0A1F5R2Y3_9BACT|nr:MAG: alanine racemase [Candidatus Edwardsbacteria bacterium RifOxyC12_full_54_24]OGF08393.1 MAG: alanine racemase [Candidatus Edwardsbacteria bacterium GWF2_54_11]OGF09068.1 MAG: alanine racemase [Candidatus Edwardsbacteria bacterium RifOxyA12_full_54_48]OGF12407.1 MAG: alanine racemase [Candidatus Edwardsbacteria bacterium GWE2_54_12]OGF17488.1 MAG: alanine racemase [Candidatus Edwardsbacteria bacterium RIFOXYD12_FULL_50_11]OGJ17768.1 MAG: alanine racemase [Candidatus Edwardsbacteria bacte
MNKNINWVEIDRAALLGNIRAFRKLLGPQAKFMPVIKSNAYGHGLPEVASILAGSKLVDWLGLNSLDEAVALREQGVRKPLLLLGYVPLGRLAEAARNDIRLTAYNQETVLALAKIKIKKKIPLHIKLETGTNRQGVDLAAAISLAALIKKYPHLFLEGYSTHFANIEDTTDRSYPDSQKENYQRMIARLEKLGHSAPVNHVACTAAALIFPDTHKNLARIGIGLYGLWPSRETMLAVRDSDPGFSLAPVLSWKTRVAQVKTVPSGSFISYGCTYRTTRKTRLAVLPVGYYDGYDRRLSNTAHVLIKGKRAPIRGRVCMNLCLADITDIPGVKLEDEAVLLGRQGQEQISAEQLAQWIGTINYEVVTRINPLLPRIIVNR